MTPWRERMRHVLTWRGALSSRFGLERVTLHLTAVLALPLTAIALLLLSASSPGYAELRTAAITLPIVWVASLIVRVAAQVLAIGSHGDEFEMVIGPTGNMSNDYQHLSGPAMLSYAVAGQSATLLLAMLGLLVLGAIAPSPANGLTIASILDFHAGWGSNAWASQIVWVNAFLFGLHLLPAAPFDARALVVGWTQVSRPNLPPWRVHRLLAAIDSHLAVGLAGFALAMIATRLAAMEPVFSWYALLFVAVYLLTLSQFEAYQAQQEEEFSTEPPLARPWKQRDPAGVNLLRQPKLGGDYATLSSFAEPPEAAPAPEALDIDEILRKLHREGQEALSAFEKEALLIASRELQARRQPPR
ncbi:MAG: hypothetical protein ACTHOU_06365 [Aureliella sp.]